MHQLYTLTGRHIVAQRTVITDGWLRFSGDTIRYFNVRSKADISQLNLPHGNRQLKSVKTEKK